MNKRNKKPRKKERFSEARRLYDSFSVKDMTFEEFEKKYNALVSPVRARNELKELVRFRGHQRTQRLIAAQSKRQIDAKLSEN